MPRQQERRLLTGAARRGAKRRKNSGTRWMHLSRAEVQNRTTLQSLTTFHLVNCQVTLNESLHLLLLRRILQLRIAIGIPVNPAILRFLDAALYINDTQYRVYSSLVRRWFLLDAFLHDIPETELMRARSLTPRRVIHLAIWDDAQCYHYTGFNNAQLRRIYACFGLRFILAQTQLPYIQVPSRQSNQRGVACF
eukprot:scaffold23728_cov90-Cyclotella_meneghiniana.AAC.2